MVMLASVLIRLFVSICWCWAACGLVTGAFVSPLVVACRLVVILDVRLQLFR